MKGDKIKTMKKLYKLTDENGKTRGETQWGEGVTHEALPGDPVLCTKTVLHAYTDPVLAVFMNPAHGNFESPKLWEAEGAIVADDGTKVGCKKLTTLRSIPLPEVTDTQRIAFGIYAALEVYKDKGFKKWAKGWLSGKDRTIEAARAARAAAWAAEAAAAWAAASAAAWAAAAAETGKKINFVALAKKALLIK